MNIPILGPLRWPVLKCPPMAGFQMSTEVSQSRRDGYLVCPVALQIGAPPPCAPPFPCGHSQSREQRVYSVYPRIARLHAAVHGHPVLRPVMRSSDNAGCAHGRSAGFPLKASRHPLLHLASVPAAAPVRGGDYPNGIYGDFCSDCDREPARCDPWTDPCWSAIVHGTQSRSP
jgi:hypothetical protein